MTALRLAHLDCVAPTVLLAVEDRRAAAGPSASAAMRALVVRLGDRCFDSAFA
jgi:predicted S18 family serine protease